MIASIREGLSKALSLWFRQRGYSLRWMPPRVYSQANLTIEVNFSLLAAHLMLITPRPYFVGIGANDGVTHDPLYPFVRDFGWRGIMVEPIPEAFQALQHNYARFTGVTLVQAAVGQTDGLGTIYTVQASDPESMMMTLHSSFSRDILLRGKRWHPGLETLIVEREVPIMSFTTLLKKVCEQAIDVLKIDTEGYDLEILKSVDLLSLSPRLIMVEHANLSREHKIQMADILLDCGYRVAMTSLDMLGYKELL